MSWSVILGIRCAGGNRNSFLIFHYLPLASSSAKQIDLLGSKVQQSLIPERVKSASSLRLSKKLKAERHEIKCHSFSSHPSTHLYVTSLPGKHRKNNRSPVSPAADPFSFLWGWKALIANWETKSQTHPWPDFSHWQVARKCQKAFRAALTFKALSKFQIFPELRFTSHSLLDAYKAQSLRSGTYCVVSVSSKDLGTFWGWRKSPNSEMERTLKEWPHNLFP